MGLTTPKIVRDDDETPHRPEAVEPAGTELVDKWTWEKAVYRAREVGMKPATQHIGLLLSTFGDGNGDGIHPSIAQLVEASGRGKSGVQEALRWLREHGFIRQIYKGSGGSGRASEYRLTLPSSMLPAERAGHDDKESLNDDDELRDAHNDFGSHGNLGETDDAVPAPRRESAWGRARGREDFAGGLRRGRLTNRPDG